MFSDVLSQGREVAKGLVHPVLRKLQSATRPSGDAMLEGLAHDLARVPSLEQGWQRLCAAAWLLGFVSLRLEPEPAFASRIGARAESCILSASGRLDTAPSWTFALRVADEPAAILRATLGTEMLPFNAGRLAECVEALLARFV